MKGKKLQLRIQLPCGFLRNLPSLDVSSQSQFIPHYPTIIPIQSQSLPHPPHTKTPITLFTSSSTFHSLRCLQPFASSSSPFPSATTSHLVQNPASPHLIASSLRFHNYLFCRCAVYSFGCLLIVFLIHLFLLLCHQKSIPNSPDLPSFSPQFPHHRASQTTSTGSYCKDVFPLIPLSAAASIFSSPCAVRSTMGATRAHFNPNPNLTLTLIC